MASAVMLAVTGEDELQQQMMLVGSGKLEDFVPGDYPLRGISDLINDALRWVDEC